MKSKLLKATLLVLCAVALVVGSVLATIAYLTASSAVTNTFTVGNVTIELYESPVNASGKIVEGFTGKKNSNGNNYHLLPGTTYDKDPTVYIADGSDTLYLFVKIRNTIADIEEGLYNHPNTPANEILTERAPTIAEQMVALGWKFHCATATGDVYVYAYSAEGEAAVAGRAVGGDTGIKQVDVFHSFTIDGHVGTELNLYGGAKVNVTAFGIQTAGFGEVGTQASVNAAWAAIVETYPYESGATTN